MVSHELEDTHIEWDSTRAFQVFLSSNVPRYVHRAHLPDGPDVLVYFQFTEQNGATEWRSDTVLSAHEHMVKCKEYKKGAPLSFSIEDIPLMPKAELTKELIRQGGSDDEHPVLRRTEKEARSMGSTDDAH